MPPSLVAKMVHPVEPLTSEHSPIAQPCCASTNVSVEMPLAGGVVGNGVSLAVASGEAVAVGSAFDEPPQETASAATTTSATVRRSCLRSETSATIASASSHLGAESASVCHRPRPPRTRAGLPVATRLVARADGRLGAALSLRNVCRIQAILPPRPLGSGGPGLPTQIRQILADNN